MTSVTSCPDRDIVLRRRITSPGTQSDALQDSRGADVTCAGWLRQEKPLRLMYPWKSRPVLESQCYHFQFYGRPISARRRGAFALLFPLETNLRERHAPLPLHSINIIPNDQSVHSERPYVYARRGLRSGPAGREDCFCAAEGWSPGRRMVLFVEVGALELEIRQR